MILAIFGVLIICVFSIIIIIVQPKNRRNCFFLGGMFHDIVTEDWKRCLFYPVFLFKKIAFIAIHFTLIGDEYNGFNYTFFLVNFLPLMWFAMWPPFRYRLTNFHFLYNEVNEMVITSMISQY